MTVETHWWKLNEGTGNPSDYGNGSVNLINTNCVWISGGKVWDDTLDFNGTTAYCNINDLSNISSDISGTICGWFKMDDDSNTVETLFGFEDRNYNTLLGVLYSTQSSNTLYSIGAIIDGVTKWGGLINDSSIIGSYVHFVMTHNGVEPKFYLNGSEVSISYTTPTDKTVWVKDAFNATTPVTDLLIGTTFFANNPIYTWDGKVQDVRYFSKPLNQAEIDFLYNSGLGQSDGMVILYTRNIAEDPLITINSTNTSVVINSTNTTVNIDSTNTIVEVLE